MSFTEFALNVAHTSFKGVSGNVDGEKDNLRIGPHARVFSVCLNNHGPDFQVLVNSQIRIEW